MNTFVRDSELNDMICGWRLAISFAGGLNQRTNTPNNISTVRYQDSTPTYPR
jgi:hypothetical protein